MTRLFRGFRAAPITVAVLLLACGKDTTAPSSVASVSVSPSTAMLQVGQTQQLTASTLGSHGEALTGHPVSWSSSDATIATVSATGLVAALKPASVSISATSEGKTGTASLTVTPGAVATMRVSLRDTVIVMGNATFTTVQLLDSAGNTITNVPVTYSSSDTSVALVGIAGTVTGVYEGTTTIRATAAGKTGTVTIRVLLDPSSVDAYWKSVPNAAPDFSSYYQAVGGASIIPLRADVNRDGKHDFVMQLWHFRSVLERSTVSPDAPVPNRLVVALSNGDGTFRDGTVAVFGSPSIDLGGAAATNVAAHDLNGDGYPDWVYALNREDGRPCIRVLRNCDNWFAQDAALLSQGNGTYRPVLFGEPNYHHSIALVPLGSDVDIIASGNHLAADGRTQLTEAYSFAGGTFQAVTDYPRVGLFLYLPLALGSGGIATHFVFDGKFLVFPGPQYLMLARRSGTRSWSSTDSVVPSLSITPVDWTAWNGDKCEKCTFLFSEGGQDFVTMGYTEGCSLRMSPNAQPVAIVRRESNLILGGAGGRTSFVENVGMIHDERLRVYTVVNDHLALTDVIDGEVTSEIYPDVDCRDVNGDGYDDIVAYAIRDGARPFVYLNNHSGRFNRVPDSILPQGPNSGWSSLLLDADGDGVEDILYFPRTGCNGSPSCSFRVWKGRRPLQLPGAAKGSRVKTP